MFRCALKARGQVSTSQLDAGSQSLAESAFVRVKNWIHLFSSRDAPDQETPLLLVPSPLLSSISSCPSQLIVDAPDKSG
jgi:hypothetical protein